MVALEKKLEDHQTREASSFEHHECLYKKSQKLNRLYISIPRATLLPRLQIM